MSGDVVAHATSRPRSNRRSILLRTLRSNAELTCRNGAQRNCGQVQRLVGHRVVDIAVPWPAFVILTIRPSPVTPRSGESHPSCESDGAIFVRLSIECLLPSAPICGSPRYIESNAERKLRSRGVKSTFMDCSLLALKRVLRNLRMA